MSIVTELKYTANLDKGVCMTPIMPSFLGGDQEAHRIVVDCCRQNSREAVDLSGVGVTAYFVRADGMTIPLRGERKGNRASVQLPSACYAVIGRFSLVIKLSLSGSINTVFWGEGAVSRSRTDVVIDPDSVIPSLDDLLAQIAAMEDATARALEAASIAESKLDKNLGAEHAGQVMYVDSNGDVKTTDISDLTGDSVVVDATLTKSGMAADAAVVGKKVSELSEKKADKAYMVALFEELKALILSGDTESAVALLDHAILDNSVLA